MAKPTDALVQSLTNLTEQKIDPETLAALRALPPTPAMDYAPLVRPEVEISEIVMRRIALALVLGAEMPPLDTPAKRKMRDALAADIKKIHDAGGGVELPFDNPGDEEGPSDV